MITDPTPTTALEFAAAFLSVILEGGPQPVEAITTRAANVGISERTLRRAREQLGVKPRQTATGWTWALSRPGDQSTRGNDRPARNGRALVSRPDDQPDTVPTMVAAAVDLGVTPATAEQHKAIALACGRFPLSENLELYQRVTGRSLDERRPLSHAEAVVLIAAHEKRAKR